MGSAGEFGTVGQFPEAPFTGHWQAGCTLHGMVREERPETVVVAAEYPEDFLGVRTINYAGMHYPTRMDQLNQFDGEAARMDVGRQFLSIYPQAEPETAAISAAGSFAEATTAHVRNFLDCVRTRNRPGGTAEKGSPAALVVQMANLSMQTGRRVRWNAQAPRVEA